MYLIINCIGSYTIYNDDEYCTEITDHMNVLETDLHYYSTTGLGVHVPKVV